MFIRNEARLAVGFPAAAARLPALARHGGLLNASEAAYAAGIAQLERADPPRPAAGMPRLVTAHFRELAGHRDMAGLALRWEASGPGFDLFPALDADVTLSRAGERATTLTMAGVYRARYGDLSGGLDDAVVRDMADETIRAFVGLMAAAIAAPSLGTEAGRGGTAGGDWSWPPAFQVP